MSDDGAREVTGESGGPGWETRFHHVDQAGLELLTSDDPPTSTTRSTEITGISHRTWWLINEPGVWYGHIEGLRGTRCLPDVYAHGVCQAPVGCLMPHPQGL
ncbi:hypothetical protein AAY473_009750 [Plecturocebus cupreus]